MFRVLVNNIAVNFQNNNIVLRNISTTSIKLRRKPRWLPVAKSKMFRVPERKKQDEDEKHELRRLSNNYKLAYTNLIIICNFN